PLAGNAFTAGDRAGGDCAKGAPRHRAHAGIGLMPAALKVGLLGVGAIGQILATALDAEPDRAVLAAIADQDRPRAETFAAQLKARPAVVEIDELVRRSDLIIEAASQAALTEIVPRALRAQKGLMGMSVGGLLEHEEWFEEAERQGCRSHILSVAVDGLSGMWSMV